MVSVPPPSEPCRRFSRTRLSGQWFTSSRTDEPTSRLGPSCKAPSRQRTHWPALMINKAEPLASFHPLFEGCQHPLCPNRRFHPAPAGRGLSGTYSRCRHCHRFCFRRFDHCESTSLHPFAPPELPGFIATMGALTPGRLVHWLARASLNPLCRRPGLPAFCIEPSDHSASNHLPLPRRSLGFVFASGLPDHARVVAPFGVVRHLGFTFRQQARHNGRPNRVHLRCGLIVHLRLLSTSPRGDAVTVSYRLPEHPDRDFHPADSMQLQAHCRRWRGSGEAKDWIGRPRFPQG